MKCHVAIWDLELRSDLRQAKVKYNMKQFSNECLYHKLMQSEEEPIWGFNNMHCIRGKLCKTVLMRTKLKPKIVSSLERHARERGQETVRHGYWT